MLTAMKTTRTIIWGGGNASLVAEAQDLSSYLAGREIDGAGWHWVHWPAVPFPVLMQLGRAADGRMVCTGLVLGGTATNEVTATGLRALPLGLLLDEFGRFVPGVRDSATTFQRPTRLGPHGIPRERFVEVAELYRQALEARPSAPVRWVSETLIGYSGKPGVPESTVRRYLQRCRDLGLLGPSIPGKAGEQPPAAKRRRRR